MSTDDGEIRPGGRGRPPKHPLKLTPPVKRAGRPPVGWTGRMESGLRRLQLAEYRAPRGKDDRPLLRRIDAALRYLSRRRLRVYRARKAALQTTPAPPPVSPDSV